MHDIGFSVLDQGVKLDCKYYTPGCGFKIAIVCIFVIKIYSKVIILLYLHSNLRSNIKILFLDSAAKATI